MKYYINVLKNYANFKGRARRSEYWSFLLFNIIIVIILITVEAQNGSAVISSIYQLAVFIPSLAVGVRRMHDVGKSGWFLLVPLYNLILCLQEGEKGANKYGKDPKEAEVIKL